MPTTFIGRKDQLASIKEHICGFTSPFIISVQGPGGVGKTFLLRKIQELCPDIKGCLCYPIVDFSQTKSRTIESLMDFIAARSPGSFEEYRQTSLAFHRRGQEGSRRTISQEDVKEVFLQDFLELEEKQRCIFLFDTFELVQDTVLCNFILIMAKMVRNSVFILAGRKNQLLEPRLDGLPLVKIQLGNFDHDDGIDYILRHPAGVSLTQQEQEALYILADNGLPIKMALALDWLSRGLLMQTMADYPLEQLKGMKEEALQKPRLDFEQELVTMVSRLGTNVDQAIYIMAHVNRRFNRELLELLIPGAKAEELVAKIHELPFVKFIEDDYFVLHDELQRMVMKNVWQWSDQSHDTRREISQKVIGYYEKKINELRQKGPDEASRYEQKILEIEMLYYQLDINLIEGYQRFTGIFEAAEENRDIELAALALDTLLSDRNLPPRLNAFVRTYYTGWVHVRQQPSHELCDSIAAGIETLRTQQESYGMPEKMRKFITQEVDLRIGELYTLLGYTHRLLGNWSKAIDQYEEARQRQEKLVDDLLAAGYSKTDPSVRRAISHLAENLNDIANLRRMTGSLDTARLYCKTSLRIRESLGEERAQGHCHYVMSMIMWESGNTNEAMYSLKKARELYQRNGLFNLEHAWLDRYEGFIMYRTGNLTKALELFERAIEVTDTNPGLQDEHAEILLFLSRITLDKDHGEDYAEALDKARQALNLAVRVGNNYRIAEAYLTLCRCLVAHKRQGLEWQAAQYHEYFQTGQHLARENHYNRLESLFAELKADEAFEAHDYITAFKHYTIACQKATLFKAAVFERTLSKLSEQLDHLLWMDPDRALEMCDWVLLEWGKNSQMQAANPCLADEVNYFKNMAKGMIDRRTLIQSFYAEHRKGNWEGAEAICNQLDDLPVREGLYQGQVWYQRALVANSANNFSYARMYCERAIRIQKANHASPQELGESLLLLSQISWKLGNTAEAAVYLNRSKDLFQEANWKLGLILVNLEKAYIHFRTYQYGLSRAMLDEVAQALQQQGMNADVQLADTLNLMARLTRSDPQSAEFYEYAFQEAERRGKRALTILQDQDWYIAAEIHLTLCILYYQWYQALAKDGKMTEACHYLELAKQYNQEGWKLIQNVQSPMLASTFHGIQARLYDADGLEDQSRENFFKELIFATETKHMRLLRAIDHVEDWLLAKPEAGTINHAGWIANQWQQEELAKKYPLVSDSMKWFTTHRRYILK